MIQYHIIFSNKDINSVICNEYKLQKIMDIAH